MEAAALGLTVFLGVCLWGVVFRYALPALGRLACLYYLHSLRDELFVVGAKNPAYRQTLLYRDLDALLAGGISCTRMGRVGGWRYLKALAMMPNDQAEPTWRAKQHKAELESVFAAASDEDVKFLMGIHPRLAGAFIGLIVSFVPIVVLLLPIGAILLVFTAVVVNILGLGKKKVESPSESTSISKAGRRAANIGWALDSFKSSTTSIGKREIIAMIGRVTKTSHQRPPAGGEALS